MAVIRVKNLPEVLSSSTDAFIALDSNAGTKKITIGNLVEQVVTPDVTNLQDQIDAINAEDSSLQDQITAIVKNEKVTGGFVAYTDSAGITGTWIPLNPFGIEFTILNSDLSTSGYVRLIDAGSDNLVVKVNPSRHVEVYFNSVLLITSTDTIDNNVTYWMTLHREYLGDDYGTYYLTINGKTQGSTTSSIWGGAANVKFLTGPDGGIVNYSKLLLGVVDVDNNGSNFENPLYLVGKNLIPNFAVTQSDVPFVLYTADRITNGRNWYPSDPPQNRVYSASEILTLSNDLQIVKTFEVSNQFPCYRSSVLVPALFSANATPFFVYNDFNDYPISVPAGSSFSAFTKNKVQVSPCTDTPAGIIEVCSTFINSTNGISQNLVSSLSVDVYSGKQSGIITIFYK